MEEMHTPSGPPETSEGKTVLIVEDDPDIAEVLVQSLKEEKGQLDKVKVKSPNEVTDSARLCNPGERFDGPNS